MSTPRVYDDDASQMTLRRALAMALMAIDFAIQADGRDVPDWQLAHEVLRRELEKERARDRRGAK